MTEVGFCDALPPFFIQQTITCKVIAATCVHKKRADEGSRTLDSHVGNVVLYH